MAMNTLVFGTATFVLPLERIYTLVPKGKQFQPLNRRCCGRRQVVKVCYFFGPRS